MVKMVMFSPHHKHLKNFPYNWVQAKKRKKKKGKERRKRKEWGVSWWLSGREMRKNDEPSTSSFGPLFFCNPSFWLVGLGSFQAISEGMVSLWGFSYAYCTIPSLQPRNKPKCCLRRMVNPCRQRPRRNRPTLVDFLSVLSQISTTGERPRNGDLNLKKRSPLWGLRWL